MTARLRQAFDFNVEDLAANREGRLTLHQKELVRGQLKVARTSSFIALLVVFGSVFLFVAIAVFANQGPIPKQAIPYLIGTALLFFAIVGLVTFIGLRRLRDLRAEKISTIQGPVRLATKRFNHGRWTGYYAQIRNIRFQLTSEAQFKALVDDNAYQIYFIQYPPTQVILSLEEIP